MRSRRGCTNCLSSSSDLASKLDVIEVHSAWAAAEGGSVLGADANGDRIDIGQVYAERRQVDDPLVPSC